MVSAVPRAATRLLDLLKGPPGGRWQPSELKWGNFLSHLEHVRHPHYLTHEKCSSKALKLAPTAGGSGSESGSGGGNEGGGGVVSGREWTAREKTELIEWAAKVFCHGCAAHGLVGDGVGMRGLFCKPLASFPTFLLALSTMPGSASYKAWVTDKITAKVEAWQEPHSPWWRGGEKYPFKLSLSFSMDAWVGMNGKY